MAVVHDTGPRRAVIGNHKSFWIYDSDNGFDLTHPESPTSPPILPRIKIETNKAPITVDPAKTAFVIIDMQNYFLSSLMGRPNGPGHYACDNLMQHAIPTARKAGVRIIWLNWGLTQQETDEVPPSLARAFGFFGESNGEKIALDKHGEPRNTRRAGLGSHCGSARDPATGAEIDMGRVLMRGQWNSALYPPLDRAYEEGKMLEARPDVWIHKNRMSGMWGAKTECEEFLESEGIRTLLFAGVNTDQCVGGTYQDSFSKGYDCVLLSDGCGTTSPQYAQQCVEYNAADTWGFLTTCKKFAEGVNGMQN